MRVGERIITGLFLYTPGVIYTENDLILVNGVLYTSNEEFTPNSESDILDHCTPYVDTITYSSEGVSPLNLQEFINVFQNYIQGIGLMSIKRLVIDGVGNNTIKSRLNTGVFQVKLLDNGEFSIPENNDYILKVHRIDENVIIQEWLDYYNINVWCLRTEDGGETWIERALISKDSENYVTSEILSTINKYKKFISAIKKNSFIQYKISSDSSINEFEVDESFAGSFTAILTSDDALIKQVTFDLTNYSTQVYRDSEFELSATKTNNNIRLSTNSETWKISTIISSKILIN